MLGLPKGSLEEATMRLFAKAGFNIKKGSRSYRLAIDDPELDGRLVRAQEISRYVEHGFFDCGLTGYDWIVENRSDVVKICDLNYSRASNARARWVLAVPEHSPIKSLNDLKGKRIATEVVEVVRNFLERNNIQAEVEFSWGATEMKVPDLADAIVDITETGNSLRANQLRVVTTVLETNTQFIANPKSWAQPEKRSKIENIALLLQSALEAGGKVGLKMNAPKAQIDRILKDLPSLRNPTIAALSSDDWVAIETVVDEALVREIIPRLKALGAEGIIEYPLNKVVP